MPVGAFLSDQISSAGGKIAGSGAPSQPSPLVSVDDPRFGPIGMTGSGRMVPGGSGGSSSGSSTPLVPATPGAAYDPTKPGPVVGPASDPAAQTYASQQAAIEAMAQTMYGPQTELLNQQYQRQQEQLYGIGIDADYKRDALTRDTALARQLLGLDKQGIGVDRKLTNTQLANLEKLRAILGQQYGLASEGHNLTDEQLRDMAGRKIWDLRSDLTQRGAFNTVANERGTGRINRDLDYGLRQSSIDYRNQVLGLNEKGISYDNQKAALGAKLSNLGLDEQRLGIKGEQLNNALADGMHNIGMSEFTTVNGILDMMNSTNQQQAELGQQIFQAIIQYSGLPPEVIAQIQKAMGLAPAPAPLNKPSTRTKRAV